MNLCSFSWCDFVGIIHQTQLIIFRIKKRKKKPVEYAIEEEREKGEEETVYTLLFFLSYSLFEMIGGRD